MEMKSLIDLQVILTNEINKINEDYQYRKDIKNELIQNFARKGLSINIVQQVFNDIRVIATLDNEQLLPLAYFLEKILRKSKLDEDNRESVKQIGLTWTVKEFFYEKAINELEDMELNMEEKEDNLVIFDNVMYDEDCNEYLCYIDLYKIHQLYKRKMINYNFETQRDPLYKSTSTGITYRVANVNQRAVQDIKLMMVNNKFTSNTIVYNIRNISGAIPQIDYREDIRQLAIKLNFERGDERETWIDVIDGQHRCVAATKAVDEANKDSKRLTDKLVLIIKNFTEEQAQDFINREEKGKRLATEYTAMLNKTNNNVRFVTELNTSGNEKTNPYYGFIAKDYNAVTFYGKKITGDDIQKTMKFSNGEKIVNNRFKTQAFIKILINKSKLFYDYVESEIFNDDKEEFNKSIFNDNNMLLILIPAVFNNQNADDIQFVTEFYDYVKNNEEYFKKEFSNKNRLAIKRITKKIVQEFNI